MNNVPQKAGIYFARSGKPPSGWKKDEYDLIVWVTGTAPFLEIYRKVGANSLETVTDVFRDPEVWGPELHAPRLVEGAHEESSPNQEEKGIRRGYYLASVLCKDLTDELLFKQAHAGNEGRQQDAQKFKWQCEIVHQLRTQFERLVADLEPADE